VGLLIEREELRNNVTQRVVTMFDQGILEEVAALKTQYGWDIEPMKGIGYREFKPYFLNTQSLDHVKAEMIKDTLGLAKKQRTWFKRNKSIHWVSNKSEAVAYTTTVLNK
jgi:tRNA dimethylallyltransferase